MPKKTAPRKTPQTRASKVPSAQPDDLLAVVKARFDDHMERHAGLAWSDVRVRLDAHPEALRSLQEMESTGGEPDVIGRDSKTGEMIFCDCSKETPAGRRSLCYDQEALDSRKHHPPQGSAIATAAAMGIEILDEAEYRALQSLCELDTTTSSWIRTPADIRERGGALFCDRRYGQVFVYHNGAESYYAARGFRGSLRI